MSTTSLFPVKLSWLSPVVSLLVILTMSQFSVAQANVAPPAGSTRIENLMLLKYPNIQDELKMTKAQKDAIEAAYSVYRSAAEPIVKRIEKSGKMPTRSDENAMRNHTNIFEGKLLGTLTAAQRARLRQLSLQAGGTAMLLHPEVSGQLKLTSQQKTKLTNLIQGALRKIQAVERSAAEKQGLTNEANTKKLSEAQIKAKIDAAAKIAQPQVEKIRLETRRQLLAVLSEQQRSQWQSMMGKPFIK